ncbi:MAG: hypothetical protein RL141_899 [Candidatus Parcubacteria bacterium]|jgi:hypothetical protein
MPFSKLKAAWDRFQAGLMWFGERVSDLLFMVLYYTVFAVVAIPYRLFVRAHRGTTSAFRAPSPAFTRPEFSEEW